MSEVEKKELIIVEGIQAPATFKMNGLDEFIAAVKAEIRSTNPDISTAKGRDEIRSKAHTIRKIKTAVDKLGKDAGEDARKLIADINAERNRGVEILQKFEEETRKPLTDWENKNKERIEKHEMAINQIIDAGRTSLSNWQGIPLEQLQERYKKLLDDYSSQSDWEEFEKKAEAALEQAVKEIQEAISRRTKFDAEQAELAQLRKEKEDRDRKDREAKIAQDAADKVKREAEEKADKEAKAAEAKLKAEREESARKIAEENRKREEAEERARKAEEEARLASEKAEREKKEVEEKAERDRKAAEEKAERERKETEARIERERKEAAEAERKRLEQIQREKSSRQKHFIISLDGVLWQATMLQVSEADAIARANDDVQAETFVKKYDGKIIEISGQKIVRFLNDKPQAA